MYIFDLGGGGSYNFSYLLMFFFFIFLSYTSHKLDLFLWCFPSLLPLSVLWLITNTFGKLNIQEIILLTEKEEEKPAEIN